MNRLLVTLAVSLILTTWSYASAAPAATVAPPASSTITQTQVKPFDLNQVTADELVTIKGIGPALAKAVVDYRQKNGAFRKVDDLLGVAGIGPKNLEKFRPYLTVPVNK